MTRRGIRRGLQIAGMTVGLALAGPAHAAEGADRRVEVPLEIGVGPVSYTWFGAVGADRPFHTGLVVTTDIVLDREWLREHPDQVPERWRRRVGYLDEVRIRPLWFLPESLILSPRFATTGMIGASWRPLSLGLPLMTAPVRIGVDVAPRLTLAYLWGDTLPTPQAPRSTLFLRPGVDLTADVVFPIDEQVRIRVGLDAQVYVPQELGGFGLGRPGERMAFLARGLVELRYRVPIRVQR